MEYRQLGRTGIEVSLIGLGTMTWGEQNTQAEAFEQMDYAVDQGVNLFDTAELYAIPPKAETQGNTETIIGHWFKQRGCRDKIILASKVVGRSGMMWFRDQETRLNRDQIERAIDGSLQRLQTDYIDVYQLHWPDRKINVFGGLSYQHHEDESVAIEETLNVLNDLVKAGKIRYVGLSNETPWGVSQFLQAADRLGLPRIVSIQNAYNLLNRTFEMGLSEFAHREQVGLLAYSPLSQGYLTGKYQNGALPEGARKTLFARLDRYESEVALQAIDRYISLAQEHSLDPAQMALAFVNQQPFVTSNLIGATTMEQLKTNIDSLNLALSEEVLQTIEEIHLLSPNPSP